MVGRKFLGLAAAVLALVGTGRSSSADTISLVDSATSNYAAGEFAYNVTITAGTEVRNGDGFVIYDFAGYQSTLVGLPGFTVTTANSGSGAFAFTTALGSNNAAFAAAFDDPTATNVIFTRTGGTLFIDPTPGNDLVQTIRLRSIFNTAAIDIVSFVSEDSTGQTATNNPLIGSSAQGALTVPAVIPLPAAAWGGMALFGLVAGGRLRKSKKAIA